jgi:hypothetical protein
MGAPAPCSCPAMHCLALAISSCPSHPAAPEFQQLVTDEETQRAFAAILPPGDT